jgi:hypothetical protein
VVLKPNRAQKKVSPVRPVCLDSEPDALDPGPVPAGRDGRARLKGVAVTCEGWSRGGFGSACTENRVQTVESVQVGPDLEASGADA